MLSRAKRLRKTIDSYCHEKDHEKFQLTANQWKQIDYLLCLLQPFHDFTNAMSKSQTATIHQVFDVYNSLFEHITLTKERLNQKTVPWKKDMFKALEASHTKLRKYYWEMADINTPPNLYAIGTMLAPSHKLQYFSSWGPDYQQKCQSMMKERIQSYQKLFDLQTLPKPQPISDSSDLTSLLSRQRPKKPQTDSDELDRYLSTGTVPINPLVFWREHQKEYPTLARIARDTLSIPATSAGVERMFNYARDICHYRRGSLNEETISNLMMYMCTSKFEYRDDFDRYTDELHGKQQASQIQINHDTFDLDLISDDEDLILVNPLPTVSQGIYQAGRDEHQDEYQDEYQDEHQDEHRDEYQDDQDKDMVNPYSFPVLSPLIPTRKRSLDESSSDELPSSSLVRASGRTRKAPRFYEGWIN